MINTLGVQGNIAAIEQTMSQIVRAVERGNVGTIKPLVETVRGYCKGVRDLLNESSHHVELVADLSKNVEPPASVPAADVPAWISERWRTMESPPATTEDGSQVNDDPKVGGENVGDTTNDAS